MLKAFKVEVLRVKGKRNGWSRVDAKKCLEKGNGKNDGNKHTREKGSGGGLGLWNVYQGEENGGEGENE